MATRLTLRLSTTVKRAIPQNGYKDMLRAGTTGTLVALGLVSATDANGERRFGFPTGSIPMGFWSERLAAEYTISGAITCSIRASTTVAGRKLRVRVYKITFGGSDVETLVAEGVSVADVSTGARTALSITATPAAAITLAPNERFILRLWLTNTDGSETATVGYGSVGEVGWMELTENVTLKDNGTRLYLRDTSASGIGTFYDMLDVPGASLVYGIVDTVASGTEEAWRRSGSLPSNITISEVTAARIASTANATTYASASFTPVATRLYILAVVTSDAAPETTIPTVSTTTGLSFVEESTVVFDTVASNVHRLTVFRAMKPSGLSAGTLTVTLADAGTGCAAQLFELQNINLAGSDGWGPASHPPPEINGVNAGANPSLPLTAMASGSLATDGVFAAFGMDIATVPTVGSGYTGFPHGTYDTPTTGLFCEFKVGIPSVADLTLATSDWGAIAVYVAHKVPAPSATVLEWIGPRFSSGFIIDAAPDVGAVLTGDVSHFDANASARVKLFRRTPDGTETLVATFSRTSELIEPVTSVMSPGSWTINNVTTFAEDDRLVCRAYLINIGTMAAGHYARLLFNGVTSGVNYVTLWPEPDLKDESDPSASPAPSGLAMSGAGT